VLRHPIVFLVAAACAAVVLLALAAPKLRLRYSANATVHVDTLVPHLLKAADDAPRTASPAHYQSFLRTLMERAGSPELLARAARRLKQDHQLSESPEELARMLKGTIQASVVKETNLLRIDAVSDRRNWPSLAANAAALSLADLVREERQQDLLSRTAPLLSEQVSMAARRDVLREEAALEAQRTASLASTSILLQRISDLESALTIEELAVNRAIAEERAVAKRVEELRAEVPEALVEAALLNDRLFTERMLKEEDRLRVTHGKQSGLKESHPDHAQITRNEISVRERMASDRAASLQQHRRLIEQSRQMEANALLLDAQLKRESALALRDAIRAEVTTLRVQAQERAHADQLLFERSQAEKALADQLRTVEARLEQLLVESRAPAQVTVSSLAPQEPETSRNLRPFVYAGVLMGAAFIGLLAASLAERRRSVILSAKDVERLRIPVLHDARGRIANLLPRILPYVKNKRTHQASMVVSGLHVGNDHVRGFAEQLVLEASMEKVAALLTFDEGTKLDDDLHQPVARLSRSLTWKVRGTPERIPALLSQPTSQTTWEKFQEMAWFCVATAPTSDPVHGAATFLSSGSPLVLLVSVGQTTVTDVLQLQLEMSRLGARIGGVVLVDGSSNSWVR
jgi:hypothetical protein